MRECTRVYKGQDWASVATDELDSWLTHNPGWSTDRPADFKEPEQAPEPEPEPEPESSATPSTTEDDEAPASTFEEAETGGPLVAGTRVFWTKPCGSVVSGTVDSVSGEHAIVQEDGKKKLKVRTSVLKLLK